MGERWIAEAENLKTGSHPGTMEGGKPKVTWHVTVCPSGGGYFDAMHRVLVSKESEPHILYDPLTDRLGQYFPLDTSARALSNDGDRRTNGSGSVNIQIEVVAMPDDFTRYWKPGPNYRALLRAIRSWGVPDAWPGGNPYGRPARTWATYVKAGHFGHVHVPGNDHYDPQVKDGALLFIPEEDFLSALSEAEQRNLYNRVMGGIPAGSAVGRVDAAGKPARLLDTGDGGYLLTKIQDAAVDPAAIAAAIPADVAQQVANELAKRLNSPEVS